MDGITLVLSLLPALFETVVEMSEVLKVDAERRNAWTDLATHIAPYPTGFVQNLFFWKNDFQQIEKRNSF